MVPAMVTAIFAMVTGISSGCHRPSDHCNLFNGKHLAMVTGRHSARVGSKLVMHTQPTLSDHCSNHCSNRCNGCSPDGGPVGAFKGKTVTSFATLTAMVTAMVAMVTAMVAMVAAMVTHFRGFSIAMVAALVAMVTPAPPRGLLPRAGCSPGVRILRIQLPPDPEGRLRPPRRPTSAPLPLTRAPYPLTRRRRVTRRDSLHPDARPGIRATTSATL